MISWVVASEREGAQTKRYLGVIGQSRKARNFTEEIHGKVCETGWEPRIRSRGKLRLILSTAGHEKSCRKDRGPSRKAKYSIVTDSEPVPWGKGEKNPGRGVKENLKPYAYKKSEPVKGWWRAFCRMNRRVMIVSEVKQEMRSRSESESEKGE